MDLSHRLEISYYKTIATINEAHNIYLVQHQTSHRIFVKKILDVYNLEVYNKLYHNPISGTPRIIEYCEDENQLLLIEEYISGTPLDNKISNNSIDIPDIVSYTFDLCNILKKMHSFNPPIIHRDIKPSNIIITSYNQAVLLDFNAAKHFTSSEQKDTILLGTQGYAAPEQYGFASSSPQTDIYSLGIVIKEMLSACNSHSNELEQIADKCTQFNPKERYSSINELMKELTPMVNKSAKRNMDKPCRSFLIPPGYRTFTPWKMLTSSISYLFIFLMSLSLEVNNINGISLWIQRLFCLAIMLSVVFGSFNYLNIQKFMPLCQHKNILVRYLGVIILNIILVFALMIMLVIIESVFY